MKRYRTSKLEQLLTDAIKNGDDARMEEIEQRIEQKERKR